MFLLERVFPNPEKPMIPGFSRLRAPCLGNVWSRNQQPAAFMTLCLCSRFLKSRGIQGRAIELLELQRAVHSAWCRALEGKMLWLMEHW